MKLIEDIRRVEYGDTVGVMISSPSFKPRKGIILPVILDMTTEVYSVMFFGGYNTIKMDNRVFSEKINSKSAVMSYIRKVYGGNASFYKFCCSEEALRWMATSEKLFYSTAYPVKDIVVGGLPESYQFVGFEFPKIEPNMVVRRGYITNITTVSGVKYTYIMPGVDEENLFTERQYLFDSKIEAVGALSKVFGIEKVYLFKEMDDLYTWMFIGKRMQFFDTDD